MALPAQPRGCRARFSGAHQYRSPAAGDLCVQIRRQVTDPGQIQRQRVHGELGRPKARSHPKHQSQRRSRPLGSAHANGPQGRGPVENLGLTQFEWPQHHVIGQTIFTGAGRIACHHTAQAAVARHRQAGGQRGLAQVRLQLHDCHGRQRRQIARIDHLQQVLGETREFGVELELHARGQKRKPLEQPLDIGIGAFQAFEAQSSGDLRELTRKFRAHVLYMLQLVLVIAK
jgi:hypothetical protein